MEITIIEKPSYQEQFAKWINSLEYKDRCAYFNQIALACDTTYNCVKNWAVGKTKIRRPMAEKINEVAGETIINL